MHVKWVEFLQQYTYVLNYYNEFENKSSDALSKVVILRTIKTKVTDHINEDYITCENFYAILIRHKEWIIHASQWLHG